MAGTAEALAGDLDGGDWSSLWWRERCWSKAGEGREGESRGGFEATLAVALLSPMNAVDVSDAGGLVAREEEGKGRELWGLWPIDAEERG
ncbi:hypothetical protein P3S67_017977 [Capsicum chacoense]